MARPLRIEYDGALYHITARGNERKPIFRDEEGRKIFLDTLTLTSKKYNWICHAYCLMNNHYHLVIETPEGNLSKGMRQVNGVYTQQFNRRHHRVFAFLLLTLASAGTFLHTGLKLPYYMFFGKDSGIRVKEPPLNMLIAMGIASFLCIFIGCFPSVLYEHLPFPVQYVPYTAHHVMSALGILGFTALGFFLLLRQLDPEPIVSLDTDWFYRKGAKGFMWMLYNPLGRLGAGINKVVFNAIPSSLIWASKNPKAVARIAFDSAIMMVSGPYRKARLQEKIKKEVEIYPGDIIRHMPIGFTVLGATLILFAYILVYYIA